MKIAKKVLVVLMGFTLVFSQAGICASADEPKTPVEYIDENGVRQETNDYTIIENECEYLGDGFWVVNGIVETSKTLQVSDRVNLILCNGGKLTVTGGITVKYTDNAQLYIYANSTDESEMGELYAEGADDRAGIGSGIGSEGFPTRAGTIVIYGGKITARGGSNAAGIGGSAYGSGGDITINGGIVNATGGSNAAGIGGGLNGSSGNITITRGEITAIGGLNADGIGKGDGGSDNLNIVLSGIYVNLSLDDLKNSQVVLSEQNIGNEPTHEEASPSRSEGNGRLLTFSFKGAGTNNNGKEIGGICTIDQQGPLCVAVFKAATPAGFSEAFSFNLNTDVTGINAPNYENKEGNFVLTIPDGLRKQGRAFALIGVDINGRPKLFFDNDTLDETFSTHLDMDGYAFSLIYK